MTMAHATLTQVQAAYLAAKQLALELAEYNQGDAAPSVSPGRFPLATIDTQITTLQTALTAVVSAS